MMRGIPVPALHALALGCLLTACGHPAGPDELAEVERLGRELDSMTAKLNAMDTVALKHMGALFEAERPGIELRFRDTLQPQEARLLGNYHRAMAERLPQLMAARTSELDRLEQAARRLHDLRHDMEQGTMNRNDRKAALAMERQWAAVLKSDLDSLAARTKHLIDARQAYRAALDSLLHQ